MSSLALTMPHGVDAFSESTSAAGTTGRQMAEVLREVLRSGEVRASNWSVSVDSSIAEIMRECAQSNWDGYGAPPVKQRALQNARSLAVSLFEVLPTGIPAPDVVPEVDGDVSLSWTRDRNRGLSISVSDHDRLNFAGVLDKGVERHGVEVFDGEDRRILQELGQYIARLYGR
jgi:hypothetical protein